jgi:hypothetical protein
MSATATPKFKTPKEIVIAAAPVADEILEICADEPISVVLMALMLAQIQVADHANLGQETLAQLFDELWTAREIYQKMIDEAH